MTAPLDFFQYRNGVLSVDGVSLATVAKRFGTPAYVYSAEGFLSPLRALQSGLEPAPHLICFAVKACSNIAILKLLARAGAGVDLVSGGELFRAEKAGIPGDRIVFSGVGKTPEEMRDALSYRRTGIHSFNVESVAELQLLDSVARAVGRRARVALRFNPDVDPKTHPYISTGLKKNKFGITRREVREVIRNLHGLRGIDLRGISIHIGSQLTSLSPLADSFARTRALMDEIEPLLPAPLDFIDLGGGLGITYRNEKPPRVADYAKLVLRHFGPRSGLPRSLQIVIEPGRIISGNAGVLLTEVLFRKAREKKDFIVVDAAMNDLMRPSLYGSYHEIAPVDLRTARGRKMKTDVVGPVCETGDCFASDRNLPTRLDSGDLVALLSAGAYGFSMASNYNSRPRACEIMIQGGRIQVIRARETFEDLVRGEKGGTD